MAIAVGWAAAVAVAAMVGSIFSGTLHFAPNACERFEPYLKSKIVGQGLALHQISDAICDHLADKNPRKPLVLSIHGPPGVGKSLFHQEAARVLYNTRPSADLRCPGPDCGGYKVLFGLDFTADDRAAQHAALREALSEHMRSSPEALLVVEEYDKLDCTMRGFFRHLLEGGAVGNFSLAKSIIVLESNTGYLTLHGMLKKAGSRERISPESAQKELKDLVFERWRQEGCEERTDTLKMVGLVDFFLPFFPLERKHVIELFELRLRERGVKLAASVGARGKKSRNLLEWDQSAIEFLTSRVDFEGNYPIEGGKEVNTLLSRYASRPIRDFASKLKEEKAAVKKVERLNRGILRAVPGTRDRLEVVSLLE